MAETTQLSGEIEERVLLVALGLGLVAVSNEFDLAIVGHVRGSTLRVLDPEGGLPKNQTAVRGWIEREIDTELCPLLLQALGV